MASWVKMERFKRFGCLWVAVALWGYLLPDQTASLALDLSELEIHSQSASKQIAFGESDSSRRNHDCHSCVALHPGAWAGSAQPQVLFGALAKEGARLPDCRLQTIHRQADSPNKRSPPA